MTCRGVASRLTVNEYMAAVNLDNMAVDCVLRVLIISCVD